MTKEQLKKGREIRLHINELEDLRDALSATNPLRTNFLTVHFDERDVEILKDILEKRIEELEKEFENL